MKYYRIFFLLAFFSITCLASAQEAYSFMFFNENYAEILDSSASLKSADDYYWRARVLEKQSNILQAISILEEGNIIFSEVEELQFLLANYYYETSQFSKALPLLRDKSDNIEAFIKIINILDFQGNNRISIKLLNERIEEDTLNQELHKLLGDNYLRVDSFQLAIKHYCDVIKINPDDQKYAYRLAKSYNKIEEYDKAISICDTVIKRDSTSLNFIKLKGVSCFKNEDFKNAGICFSHLWNNGDSSIFILKHLGICEYKNEELIIAKHLLLNSYLLDSSDYETSFFLAKCYVNSIDLDSGLFFLDKTEILLLPDSETLSAIYLEKAKFYISLMEFNKAISCFETAHAYTPINSLYFTIASIYQYRLKNMQEALNSYEKFLSNVQRANNEENLESDMSLKKMAEDRIKIIREELFFDGKLTN